MMSLDTVYGRALRSTLEIDTFCLSEIAILRVASAPLIQADTGQRSRPFDRCPRRGLLHHFDKRIRNPPSKRKLVHKQFQIEKSQRRIRRKIHCIHILASDYRLADLRFFARNDIRVAVWLVTLLDKGVNLFIQPLDVCVNSSEVFQYFSTHSDEGYTESKAGA
jgi:hypothetical protein